MEEERKREIAKLVRVLHQIAFAEKFSSWSEQQKDISQFSVQQYNNVFARLKEIEPSIDGLFVELTADAGPRVIRIAARELADYFEEDIPKVEFKNFVGFVACVNRRKGAFAFSPRFRHRCG